MDRNDTHQQHQATAFPRHRAAPLLMAATQSHPALVLYLRKLPLRLSASSRWVRGEQLLSRMDANASGSYDHHSIRERSTSLTSPHLRQLEHANHARASTTTPRMLTAAMATALLLFTPQGQAINRAAQVARVCIRRHHCHRLQPHLPSALSDVIKVWATSRNY